MTPWSVDTFSKLKVRGRKIMVGAKTPTPIGLTGQSLTDCK